MSQSFVNSSILNQSLEQIESIDALSSKLDDYLNVFLLPLICLVGIFTNGVSIAVIIKMAQNEIIHLYMLVNSIADLTFLLSQFFLIFIRCGSICPYGYSYGSKFIELYIYLHLGYTLALFAALNDIGVSIDRALSFRLTASPNHSVSRNLANTSHAKRNYFLRIALLFIASFVLNLPMYVLSREIAPVVVCTV